MKISYNWLKNYFDTEIPVEQAAALLTAGGLEVESVEKFETIKGGLHGLVVGEVKTREKHPDADRLSVTTVDVGGPVLLNIVCGAANVAAGQKVVVAIEGAKLYPAEGEPFVIKKSKIRGQPSEGMICAEDEIGLGKSHEGILVLDSTARIGMPASEYFGIEGDEVLEIGLTPNRADAASHIGVARDLVALVNCTAVSEERTQFVLPDITAFAIGKKGMSIAVEVEEKEACPRYSGLCITGITVKESPDWLKNRLKTIGLRPINNIVDITNYVLHELGQPLHAFDANKIQGGKIIVKKCPAKTKFRTLDEVERELSENDLMICDAHEPLCIAGVFGGIGSGVTEKTHTLFLESACFNPVSIRRTSRFHGLKTDASFRYERGTDPDITVFALKRAAILITELAGGEVSSDIVDIYPTPVPPFRIPFAFSACDKLIGKKIDSEKIRQILTSLGIVIESDSNDALLLVVPPRKVDVTRECDVVEEVLRIYGYNNIEIPTRMHSSVSAAPRPDKERIRQIVSAQLSTLGFSEIVCNSLTKGAYYENNPSFKAEQSIQLLNPLSSDLNVMRQSLLYSGLEVIAYNQNRKQQDLKLYEFGKTYLRSERGYHESSHLSLFLTGRKVPEAWNALNSPSDFFQLKAFVMGIFTRLGIPVTAVTELSGDLFSAGLKIESRKKTVAEFGMVCKSALKQADLASDVLFADLNWDNILSSIPEKDNTYKEVSRFPAVRRDLALILDKKIPFKEVEQLAYQTEKSYLKALNLFDVFEGEKLGKDKKSYAVSFTLQDNEATLTDKQIEKIMEKLMKTYQDKLGAEIRQ
jgi:phenylalanyl-tRNA synthetase beta chain